MVVLAALVLLQGVVHVAPTSPVCRVGTPCQRPAANVTLRFVRPGRVVATRTDRAGRYRVSLAPGNWTVRASIGKAITPRSFFLLHVRSTRRNFLIDSGIR